MPENGGRSYFFWIPLLILLVGCDVTRHLQEDQTLLVKNNISGLPSQTANEAKKILKPRTNKKFLFLWRFNTWVYLVTSKGKENRLKWSLKRSIGEEPAIYDSVQIKESALALQRYLKDRGYFRNKIDIEVTTKGRRTSVNYRVIDSVQYTFRKIHYSNGDRPIDQLIYAASPLSVIQDKKPYDLEHLNVERARIAEYLRNRGYFYFSREFQYFELDTSVGNRQVDVYPKLRVPQAEYLYKPFVFDAIRINSNVDMYRNSSDSLVGPFRIADDLMHLQNIPGSVEDEVLESCIQFRPNELFSEDKIRFSQSRLSALGIYSNISFKMRPILNDSVPKVGVDVFLTPAKKVETRLEAEGSTNSVSLFGISGSYLIRDKNIFKGGELLEFRLNGGIESQQFNNPTLDNRSLPFNTLEYGGSVSMVIPKFLFPFRSFNKSNYFAPKTRFQISFFNQNRFDYNRSILNLSIGYEWVNRANERWGFYPFELNLARTGNLDSVLKERLDQINDPFLKFSFTNHLTSGTRVTYTANNLNHDNPAKRTFSRITLESSGNIINLIQTLADPDAGTPRQLLGLPYFQYLRADVDLRKYWTINPQSDFAARAFVGIGVPLQNSNTLPLEKRYFVGGNNSLRGWLARQPGPGSFSGFGANRFDQFGEIKLEFNAEYRFPLIRLPNGYAVQGAIFYDAGNIWTLKDTVGNKQQYTNFSFGRAWNELAMNTGFGIRMNFTYFIIRFDVGLKLHDPAFTQGNRWVIENLLNPDWRFNQWQNELNIPNPSTTKLGVYEMWGYNLGIGLPF